MDRIPFAPGFLSRDLSNLSNVRLLGSRCTECGATSFGSTAHCVRCCGRSTCAIPLASHGRVVRMENPAHPPPQPIGILEQPTERTWLCVELFDQGPRVFGELAGASHRVHVGSEVMIVVGEGWKNVLGQAVVTFWFRAAAAS